MKFDICLMNPPYDNKLHEKFLSKLLDITETGVSIQPSVWLNKGNRNRKGFRPLIDKCNGRISHIELISHREINDLFETGNSLQDCGIFVWNKTSSLNLDSFGYNSDIEKSLYKKTNIDNNPEMMLIRGKKGQSKYVKPSEYSIKENEVAIYQWHSETDCYNSVIVPERKQNKRGALVLIFNDKNEVQNFKDSLKTKFANWFFKHYVIPGDGKIITYMFRMKDYSKPWTDKRFYKLFNLTKEEIEIIEND